MPYYQRLNTIYTKLRRVTRFNNGIHMPGGQEILHTINQNPKDVVHVYITEDLDCMVVFSSGEELKLGIIHEKYTTAVTGKNLEVVNWYVTGGYDLTAENSDGFIQVANYGFNLEIRIHEPEIVQ